MAIAGTLEIQMLANLARITDDMSKAKGIVGGAMKSIEDAVGSAKSALAALGIGLSAGYFVSLIKGSIDAAEHLENLSKSTNISVEELSGFNLLAKQSGTDLDSLAKGIDKMSVSLGKDPDKFRLLGVTARDNAGAFMQLADIFNSLGDVQQRNALAQAIFGRSWAEMAPALSEGSKKIGEIIERGKQLSGITEENARLAKEFNDKWVELTGTGGLLARLVAPMLPMLNMLADDLLEAQKKSFALDGSFKPLAETLRAMIILGGNVAFVFKGVGNELGGMAAQIAALARGDIAGFNEIRRAMLEDAAKARAEFDEWEKKMTGPVAAAKPKPGIVAPDAGTAARVSAFLGTNKELLAVTKSYVDGLKSYFDAEEKANAAQSNFNDANAQAIIDGEFQISLLGRTKVEVEKLIAARKIDLEMKAKQAQVNPELFPEQFAAIGEEAKRANKAMMAMIDARRDAERSWATGAKQTFNDYVDHATNAAEQASMLFGNAFRNMEDGLVNFVMTGKANFDDFARSVIADLVRIQIRRAMAGIFGNAGFASLFSGTAGSPVPDATISAGVGHSGGEIGRDYFPARTVPAAIFTGAPRYHLGVDEVPAILQTGERIIPRGGSGGITVHQSIHLGGNVTQADIPGILAASKQIAIAAVIDMKRRDPAGVLGS